jgi:DNA-binding transcriptional LysR family regulator
MKKAMSWKELQSLPFLRRERGSDIRDASDEWLKQHNVRLNTKLELNNTEAIKTCIKCGLGFSLLPLSTIEQDVKAGFLGVVSAPHFNLVQTYYICHYKHKDFSKPEKVFLEFLFEAIESKGTFPNMDFPLSPLL